MKNFPRLLGIAMLTAGFIWLFFFADKLVLYTALVTLAVAMLLPYIGKVIAWFQPSGVWRNH